MLLGGGVLVGLPVAGVIVVLPVVGQVIHHLDEDHGEGLGSLAALNIHIGLAELLNNLEGVELDGDSVLDRFVLEEGITVALLYGGITVALLYGGIIVAFPEEGITVAIL